MSMLQRLFVAINVPKKERDRIHRASAGLRALPLPVRWNGPEDYHLTLKFLGSVRESRIDDIAAALTKAAATNAIFDLTLRGFGGFPSIREPDVLWVGAEPSAELRCLKQDLEWCLTPLGFQREIQAFHPHVTIGRADREGSAGAFRALDGQVADMEFEVVMPVKTIDVMRAIGGASGPRYALVRTIPLAETPVLGDD